jgi:hypothetical protein
LKSSILNEDHRVGSGLLAYPPPSVELRRIEQRDTANLESDLSRDDAVEHALASSRARPRRRAIHSLTFGKWRALFHAGAGSRNSAISETLISQA